MRPRISNHRMFNLRPLTPPKASRPYTQNWSAVSRPQLPFLFYRQPGRRQERLIAQSSIGSFVFGVTKATLRYGFYVFTPIALLHVMFFGIQQEYFEQCHPTPPEWSFISRGYFREFRWYEENDDPPIWYRILSVYLGVVERLEDPKKDGADLKEQEGNIDGERAGKMGLDITLKSAEWRQGYHEALMALARAAEHLDEWVVDTTRYIAVAKNTVIGRSNPIYNRQPIKRGQRAPALEENCIPASEPPDIYYNKLLTTQGFTPKQRLDATLAYASWLDYKKAPAATEMYKQALDIALSTTADAANHSQIIDPETHILKTGSNSTATNSNLLRATTAIATHYARNGSTSTALPIFLSILRARRALPNEPETMRSTLIPDEAPPPPSPIDKVRKSTEGLMRMLFVVPKYPLDTTSGTEALIRDPKNKCEEAALMTYIGEILYASAASTSNGKAMRNAKENGLAWTREAVDIAEENLRGRLSTSPDEDAKKKCKECLETGMDNWFRMIQMLVAEEKTKAEKAAIEKKTSWFGRKNEVEMIGRWESEEAVVQERIRRAKPILGREGEDEFYPPFERKVDPKACLGLLRGWWLP